MSCARPVHSTEFFRDIGATVHALDGHPRIELECAPTDDKVRLRANGQGFFEAFFADVTPRANCIGDDIDLHATSSGVLSSIPNMFQSEAVRLLNCQVMYAKKRIAVCP